MCSGDCPRSWLPRPAPAHYELALWTGSFLRRVCGLHLPVTPNRGGPASWTHLCLTRARCARRMDWMAVMASSCPGSSLAWTAGLGTRGGGGSCGEDSGGREPFRSLCPPPGCGRAPGWPPGAHPVTNDVFCSLLTLRLERFLKCTSYHCHRGGTDTGHAYLYWVFKLLSKL